MTPDTYLLAIAMIDFAYTSKTYNPTESSFRCVLNRLVVYILLLAFFNIWAIS